MRVVVAPDKFRGSLSALQAASALAAGVLDTLPDTEVVERPVADGGEGTLDALAAAGWVLSPVDVSGPTGEPVTTHVARSGDRALVELADCCGRPRLSGAVAPLTASTAGAGEAIASAVAAGARTVVLAVGGSASTDGGLGLLRALGVRVLTAEGAEVVTPLGLASAVSVDARSCLRGMRLVLASDVASPLLGPTGAARLFGPQKGASPDEVDALEAALSRWASVLEQHCGRPVADVAGAGAAGGTVAGALGVFGAVGSGVSVELRSGAGFVLDAVGLDAALVGADLVVVGEGCLDAQSLLGKAPVAVAERAAAACVPVVAVAGRLDLDSRHMREARISGAVGLAEVARRGEDKMRDAAVLVRRAAAHLLRDRRP